MAHLSSFSHITENTTNEARTAKFHTLFSTLFTEPQQQMMSQHDCILSEPQYVIRTTRFILRCTRLVFPFDGVGQHMGQK